MSNWTRVDRGTSPCPIAILFTVDVGGELPHPVLPQSSMDLYPITVDAGCVPLSDSIV